MDQLKKSTISHSQREAIQRNFGELKKHQDVGTMWIVPFIVVLIAFLFRGLGSNRYKNENGYVLRRSESGSDQYEHRMIAEEVLERRLEAWEVVHHINGRRSDNRLANLCVMDQRDHDDYHEWYDWVFKTYGKYPRRETQLRKLRESFNGKILVDMANK